MELNPLSWIAAGAAIVGAIALNVLSNDVYDRCPRLARWVLEKAIAKLPEDKRERYHEEWEAHLLDCDTNLDQVRHAFGAWWSVAGIVAPEPRRKHKLNVNKALAVSGSVTLVGFANVIYDLAQGVPLVFVLLSELPPSLLYLGGFCCFAYVRRKGGTVIEI